MATTDDDPSADVAEIAFHLEQLAGVVANHEDQLSRLREIVHSRNQADGRDDAEHELPMPFIWDELDDTARTAYGTHLSGWVTWLVHRYRLDDHIPECWALHGAYLEELTALWVAWETAYRQPDSASSAERWHGELGWFLGRVTNHWKRQACRPGSHAATASSWTATTPESW